MSDSHQILIGMFIAIIALPFIVYFTMKAARYGWLAGGKQFARSEFRRLLKRRKD